MLIILGQFSKSSLFHYLQLTKTSIGWFMTFKKSMYITTIAEYSTVSLHISKTSEYKLVNIMFTSVSDFQLAYINI